MLADSTSHQSQSQGAQKWMANPWVVLGWRVSAFLRYSHLVTSFVGESKVLKNPGRLTWNLQITRLERKMIFQTSIMFHVNLHGCKSGCRVNSRNPQRNPTKRNIGSAMDIRGKLAELLLDLSFEWGVGQVSPCCKLISRKFLAKHF